MGVRPQGSEVGFTLVELLIVMVILPLVVAAVAVAIIATEKNAGTTKALLNDSTNAQIASEYFGPDVQGAQFLTTTTVAGTPTMPSVCGAGTGTALLLGLYRPVATGVAPMSVGYWVTTLPNQTADLMRYSCVITSDASGNLVANVQSKVLISDGVNASQQGPATITPKQFATAAGVGWAPVSASTTVASLTALTIPGAGRGRCRWRPQVRSTSVSRSPSRLRRGPNPSTARDRRSPDRQ